MKRYFTFGLTFCLGVVSRAAAQALPKEYVNRQLPMEHIAALLQLVETIPIPTEGHMDHLTYDLRNQQLFLRSSPDGVRRDTLGDFHGGAAISGAPHVCYL